MMKRKYHTLVLAFLLWNQNSRAELRLQIDQHPSSQDSDVYALVQKIADDYWFAEEQAWKVLPKVTSIEAEFSLVSADHWAETEKNKIKINIYAPKSDLDSVVKHELSHSFLNSYCPKLSDAFAHELFSYWRSGDYLRLLYGQSKIYLKAPAIKELQVNSSFNQTKAIATARIINELVSMNKKEILEVWFKEIFHNCNEEDFLKKQSSLAERFLTLVTSAEENKIAKGEFGFLMFDSLSKEVLETDGDWNKSQSTGSTMKPFMISFFSDLKRDKIKTDASEWECGDKNDRKWNYKKALNYSCNGFFLDSKIKQSELESYVATLNSLTGRSFLPRWLNSADLIGLWPTLKLSLLEIARIYDYVLTRDPNTIDILKNTAVKGTLAGSADSKWFKKNKIALKSGTTTKLDLSIEAGFLVAVIQTQTTPKIAILYRSGVHPADLLAEMKIHLNRYIDSPDSKAQVQVLSAFNPMAFQISCPTLMLKNGASVANSTLNLTSKNLQSGQIACIGAPFEVKASDGIVRRLYGALSFAKTREKSIVSIGRSEKNMRAQFGSQLVLNTSESHYMKNVFFSESLNHRVELKKALLLVIKNNLKFWNQKNQAICDSTLCQVYNLNYEQVSFSQKKQIQELILTLGKLKIESNSWLEFSLGGTEPWIQIVSNNQLFSFIQASKEDLVSGSKKDNHFEFSFSTENKKTYSCEQIRGSFKLKSCPDFLEQTEAGQFSFHGQGEGHLRGMNLSEANQLALQGFNFDKIIENYYGLKILNN